MKHTQSEWLYSKYSGGDYGVYPIEGNGNDIALVRSHAREEEAEANAKLIAAAPDLLGALIRWQNEWVVNGTPAQRANNYSIERQIDKAIVKAIN